MEDICQLKLYDNSQVDTPSIGMMTYDATNNDFKIYDGNDWKSISNNNDKII